MQITGSDWSAATKRLVVAFRDDSGASFVELRSGKEVLRTFPGATDPRFAPEPYSNWLVFTTANPLGASTVAWNLTTNQPYEVPGTNVWFAHDCLVALGPKELTLQPLRGGAPSTFAGNFRPYESAGGLSLLRADGLRAVLVAGGKWTEKSFGEPASIAVPTPSGWFTNAQNLPLGAAVDPGFTPVPAANGLVFRIAQVAHPGHTMDTRSPTYPWFHAPTTSLMFTSEGEERPLQLENGPWLNPSFREDCPYAVLEEPLAQPWPGGSYPRRFWTLNLLTADYEPLAGEGSSPAHVVGEAAILRLKNAWRFVNLRTGRTTTKDDPGSERVVGQGNLIFTGRRLFRFANGELTLVSPPNKNYLYRPALGDRYVAVENLDEGQVGYAAVGANGLTFSRMDATLSGLREADSGVTYVQQDFGKPPRLVHASPDFQNEMTLVETNPEAATFPWGTRRLLRASLGNKSLAGSLILAPDSEGEKRPLIISIYERQAGRGFEFMPPLADFPYSVGRWSQNGYHVLLPDLEFRPGEPGASVVRSLRAWLKRLQQVPEIDLTRVAVVGHSWGGYGALFAATQMPELRCAVAGAPIVDLASLYYQAYRGGLMPNAPILESEQGRMGTSPERDPARFRRNSPLTYLPQLRVPLLVGFGEQDELVSPSQAEMLTHALWLHRKDSQVLRFPESGHQWRGPDQREFSQQMDRFLAQRLKGEAP